MKHISYVTLVYLLCAVLSFLFLYLYAKMHLFNRKLHYVGVFVAFGIIDIGHFLMSLSRSLTMALFANRLIYFGTIVLLILSVIITIDLCNIKTNKYLQYIFLIISLLVYALTFTGGTSIPFYYQEVSFKVVHNIGRLIKTYGCLHDLYLGYVFIVFFILLIIVICSYFYKKIKYNSNSAILIIAVLENIFVWLIEKYMRAEFELLVISYAISEVLLLVLFKNVEDVEKMNKVLENLFNKDIKTIQDVINSWKKEYNLTQREMEVLKLLLDNVARVDIAEALFISEHTVKKHTSHIYEKMSVKSRNELLYKLNEELAKD